MTIYLGDFAAGATIYVPFHTFNSSGASVTITGLAVTDIEIYKNGSTTQRASDNGYTLLDTDGIDFDGVTGIHGFSIDTSDNTTAGFFSSGADFMVVVSSITVDSQTVSFIPAIFSIENRSALRPTTAGRTLDVASTGEAGLDYNNVNLPVGAIAALGIIDNGTLQSATSSTAVLRSAASFANDIIVGATILTTGGTGAGQARIIYDLVGATDTVSVTPNWTTTPDNTTTYLIYPSPPAPTNASALPSVRVAAIDNDVITDASMASDVPTAIATSVWANGTRTLSAGTNLNILTAADTRTALGLASANLDTQIATLPTLTQINTSRYLKNTASQKIVFVLVDSTDHVTRKTGITVTAQRSLDGATFGSCTGSVTEVGNGVYYLSTSTADINADDIVYRFTGTACDPVEIHVVTAS